MVQTVGSSPYLCVVSLRRIEVVASGPYALGLGHPKGAPKSTWRSFVILVHQIVEPREGTPPYMDKYNSTNIYLQHRRKNRKSEGVNMNITSTLNKTISESYIQTCPIINRVRTCVPIPKAHPHTLPMCFHVYVCVCVCMCVFHPRVHGADNIQ